MYVCVFFLVINKAYPLNEMMNCINHFSCSVSNLGLDLQDIHASSEYVSSKAISPKKSK